MRPICVLFSPLGFSILIISISVKLKLTTVIINSLQTCLTYFLLWNIKEDSLKNVHTPIFLRM